MNSLVKNAMYNIVYKLFLLAFPLISSVYVSRVLMPVGVGKVAYAQNVVSYFITFAGLGMATYGVREIGKVQNDRKKFSNTFTELFLITFLSTVICSTLYYGWIFFANPFKNTSLLYIVAGFQLVLGAFNVDWFYQGIEEYRFITSRSILMKLLSLVFMFVAVRNTDNVVPYALMSSIALAGNNIVNVIHIRKYIDFSIVDKIEVKKHLKPLFILLSTTITVELYTKLDTTTLGIMTSDINVGYYSYATRITTIVVTLATAISTVLLPRLSYYKELDAREALIKLLSVVHKGIVTVTVPATIGLWILSKEIVVVLFGEAFSPAVMTIRILSLLVVIKAIGNLYGVQVLMAFGAEKQLFYSTILGAVFNVCMNIVLIPVWKENGAAIASVISEFAVCILQFIISRKYIKVEIPKKIYFQIGTACTVMVFFLWIIFFVTNNYFARIVAGIGVGGIVFYLTSSMVKNELIGVVNDKVSAKIRGVKNA